MDMFRNVKRTAVQKVMRAVGTPGEDYDEIKSLVVEVESKESEKQQMSCAMFAGVSKEMYDAASTGDGHRLRVLLASNAQLYYQDKSAKTPLHQAAMNGHHECVAMLLAAGAGKDAADEHGRTPLHQAAMEGHAECVRALLVAGAAKGVKDEDNKSPLQLAVQEGHRGCVEALVGHTPAELTEARDSVERSVDDVMDSIVGQRELKLEEIVAGLDEIPIRDMLDMQAAIVPCFPSSYGIWEVIVRRFVRRIGLYFDRVAAELETSASSCTSRTSYSNGELLELIRVHISFFENVRALKDVHQEWLLFGPEIAVTETNDLIQLSDFADGHSSVSTPQVGKKALSSELATGGGCGKGFDTIMNVTVWRTSSTIAEWIRTVVPADLEDPNPKPDKDGRLFSATWVEFMRLLHQQIDRVTAVSRGELLARVLESYVILFQEFHAMQEAAVKRSIGGMTDEELETHFMQLCACVNSNSNLYDESEQMIGEFLADDSDATSSDDDCEPHRRRWNRKRLLSPEVAHRGMVLAGVPKSFLATAERALSKISEVILSGRGFKTYLDMFFCHQEWYDGTATEAIVAGLAEYIEDYKVYLMPDWYPRAVESLADGASGRYLGAFYSRCTDLDSKTLARITKDVAAIRDLFADALGWGPKRKDSQMRTDRALRRLTAIRDLGGASDETIFVEHWGDILIADPATDFVLVRRVLDMRKDLPQTTKALIVKRCILLCEEHRVPRAEEPLIKGLESEEGAAEIDLQFRSWADERKDLEEKIRRAEDAELEASQLMLEASRKAANADTIAKATAAAAAQAAAAAERADAEKAALEERVVTLWDRTCELREKLKALCSKMERAPESLPPPQAPAPQPPLGSAAASPPLLPLKSSSSTSPSSLHGVIQQVPNPAERLQSVLLASMTSESVGQVASSHASQADDCVAAVNAARSPEQAEMAATGAATAAATAFEMAAMASTQASDALELARALAAEVTGLSPGPAPGMPTAAGLQAVERARVAAERAVARAREVSEQAALAEARTDRAKTRASEMRAGVVHDLPNAAVWPQPHPQISATEPLSGFHDASVLVGVPPAPAGSAYGLHPFSGGAL